MTTEIAEKPAPDVEVDPSTTPDPTGEAPATPEDPGDPGAPDSEPKPTEEPKGSEPSGAEKRIKELVAKQRQAEREAAYWKGVAEGKDKPTDKPKPQEPVDSTKPNIENFDNYDDYIEALTDWKLEQRDQKKAEASRQTTIATQRQQKESALMEAIMDVAEDQPELLDYVRDESIPVSQAMYDVILETEKDVALKMIRYFGENRKEAARVSRMAPIAAAREMGRIEDKILNPPKVETKKVTQAPEPISTVQPKGKLTNPLDDDAPIEDFIRARNRARYGEKRG